MYSPVKVFHESVLILNLDTHFLCLFFKSSEYSFKILVFLILTLVDKVISSFKIHACFALN